MCFYRKITLISLFISLVTMIAIPRGSLAQAGSLYAGNVIWSPDGRYIAFINEYSLVPTEPTIEVFTTDLRPVRTLHINSLGLLINGYALKDIAWSNDSLAIAATVSATGPDPLVNSYVAVWDVGTGNLRFVEPYDAFYLGWSPNGNYLGAGAFILDATTGDLVSQPVTFDPGDIQFAFWNPVNEHQYFVGFDTSFVIFEPFTAERLASFDYIGAIRPEFSPDGSHLATVNRGTDSNLVIEIIDTTTYQHVVSIQPEEILLEPYALNWLANDQLALIMLDIPLTIINPFTNEVVDTVSYQSITWNTQGTQFFGAINLPTTIGGGRGLAIYDRETEGVVA